MQVGSATGAVQHVLPPVDAGELTKQVLGAVTGTTGTALDLAKVATGNASTDAPPPSAEDIAAVQQALGIAASSGTRSGASAASA